MKKRSRDIDLSNARYFWVKFYEGADWQLVKFFTRDKKEYLKGLDWMSEHRLDQFCNKCFTKGPEVFEPSLD